MAPGKWDPVPRVDIQVALRLMQNDREFLEAFEAEMERKLESTRGSLAPLSPEERMFVLRRAFQWEINNGGFYTFFYNSAGDNAADTPEVLRLIGAPEAAAMLEEGMQLFGSAGPARDTLERRQQMAHFSAEQESRLDELTSEYYRLEDAGLSTADLLDRFLLAQRRSA